MNAKSVEEKFAELQQKITELYQDIYHLRCDMEEQIKQSKLRYELDYPQMPDWDDDYNDK